MTYITEKDINDWATEANEFLLDFSVEDIMHYTKRKETPILLTDSEGNFVEMDAKMYSVGWGESYRSAGYSIVEEEQNAQINHQLVEFCYSIEWYKYCLKFKPIWPSQ